MSESLVRRAGPLTLALGLLAGACRSPDPKQEVEVSGLETYWAIDRAVGETTYLAPVARFRLRNKGTHSQRSIQTTATFRRKGEESQSWGSAFQAVGSSRKPLEVGQEALVVLTSDARYYSAAAPQSMFQHTLFKDAKVEVFVRVGSSGWVKMAESDVHRRVGSLSVQGTAP